ncbi:MAG: signal peptidase I [Methanocellales archaeon]|nr:signal peptidase I [Methanocellales archaeon]
MKKIETLGIGIIIIVLGVFLIFFRPTMLGGDTQYLIVLSGSMEPAIKMGSVVVVKPADTLQEGDIICFKNSEQKVTHRIYEVLEDGFKTKGDANEDPDARIIHPDEILGQVMFSIPYLGYLSHHARSPLGFVLLVILPAALLIIGEIRKILKYCREGGDLDQE